MSEDDFRDDPDAGVDPLAALDDESGVEPLDSEYAGAVLEELEDEWEDREAYVDEE